MFYGLITCSCIMLCYIYNCALTTCKWHCFDWQAKNVTSGVRTQATTLGLHGTKLKFRGENVNIPTNYWIKCLRKMYLHGL